MQRLSHALDSELESFSPDQFVEELHARALYWGTQIYDPDSYELVSLSSNVYRERLISYLQRRAWAEWYFGTVTPARQITLIGTQDASMCLRLARQIHDEIRHHDVFVKQIKRLGGEWRLHRYAPPPSALQMLVSQLQQSSAEELAAANQYSGEVVLSVQARPQNILQSLLDDEAMRAIIDIERDEPAHITIGRDLIRQHAEVMANKRTMAKAQEDFLEALARQHCAEIESLGAKRRRSLPMFSRPEPADSRGRERIESSGGTHTDPP